MIAHINEQTGEEQSVTEHLRSTARIAENLGRPLAITALARITALLHDAGKFRKAFEIYLRAAAVNPKSVKRGSVNHSSAGAIYLYDRYFHGSYEERLTAQMISTAIFSHHGLIDCMTAEGMNNFHRRIDAREDLDYDEVMENLHSLLITDQEVDGLFQSAVGEVCVLLEKMKENNISKFFGTALLERMLLSILIDADRLDTAVFCGSWEAESLLMDEIGGTVPGEQLPWEGLLQNLEAYLLSFTGTDKISLLRTEISKECLDFASKPDGIYKLSVPTGGAKTISSLRYAIHHANKYKKKRIFYIAPFLSILEQNSEVLGTALNDKTVILEHHSNVVLDDGDEAKTELSRYKHLTENWDCVIILTTFVQFLNTLFSDSTQSVRRFHSLENAVIIIDEIQSLPINMISIFNLVMNYLNQICGTTVILCSATQPILDKVNRKITLTPPEDMIADKQRLYRELKRVEIVEKKGLLNTGEVCSFAWELMNAPKCEVKNSLLIILNTKSAVRNVFDCLKRLYDESGEEGLLIHLSTSMCPKHRLDLIHHMKDCMGKCPVVCVSTSLIEAGVDISFSNVIRSFAGLDSIAQAAGRCNRNGESAMGVVYLIHYNEEKLGFLKQIQIAAQCSEKLADDYNSNPEGYDYDLLSPKALDAFYENYYHGQSQERLMEYPIDKRGTSMIDLLSVNKKGKTEYKDKYGSKDPNLVMFQAFKTAGQEFEVINQKTTSVLVPYKEGEELIAILNGRLQYPELPEILRKIQRYVINLYDNQMRRLNEKDALYRLENGGVLALKNGFYDEVVGLNEEGALEFLEI